VPLTGTAGPISTFGVMIAVAAVEPDPVSPGQLGAVRRRIHRR